MVFVKVSPLRHVMRFGSLRKLTPMFLGSFLILERVGKLGYRVKFHEFIMFFMYRTCGSVHDSTTAVEPSQLEEAEVENCLFVVHIPALLSMRQNYSIIR